MKTKHMIIIHRSETIAESWARDASTFVLIAALIGLGVFLESPAMQWMGALIAFFVTAVKSAGLGKKRTFDVAGARAELDRIEAEARK